MMNDQKKLKLSKETLRCLDDDALTDVVGGGKERGHGGGGFSGNCFNNTEGCFNLSVACVSDQGQCAVSDGFCLVF
jgi:hypothetical protein